ncbi:hypothetical protein IWX78_001010 [Mycetocola sp. CAN_C7]|uniref:hypothetical protein n=1 Tax=Mycetocola sp. CAN_C7 TaxID=2787724 RepID=UPI0018C960AA
MAFNFLAWFQRRVPVAAPPGQDEDYSPVPEGEALLGTGPDQLRAWLLLHPRRAAALEAACAPLRERLASVSDAEPSALSGRFPHSSRAARDPDATMWDALFSDLSEASSGGPGITLNPLAVLMSVAVSHAVYSSDDGGLLFVAADARSAADTIVDEIPGIGNVIADLLDVSRSTIAARATQAGITSILVHRRFTTSESPGVIIEHQLDSGPASTLVGRVAADIDFHTLSLWFDDIDIARDWSPAADPSSTSVVVLSVRVPVESIWMAPRRNSRDFLISAEALEPVHSEVLNRD